MLQNENTSFSHPPSAQELMEMCAQSEQNDPKSIYYKRLIVRPKIPILKIILFLTLTLLVCVSSFAVVLTSTKETALAILVCVCVLLLICVIFAKNILITLVKIYQALAPEDIRKRCRYEPSCSNYMILSVKKYGFWHGVKKGIKRWKGCKPPNGGIDMP